MATFTDTFERADGPPGANWQRNSTGVTISGGRLVSSVPASCVCLASSESGPQTAEATFRFLGSADYSQYVYVKATANTSQFYRGFLVVTNSVLTASIARSDQATVALATTRVEQSLGSQITLRLVYNTGHLQLYVNDVLNCQVDDATFDGNVYAGVQCVNGGSGIDSFTTQGADSTTFSVSPNAARAGGQPIPIVLTATGTAWTAGQPGTPTFTVSAGSLSDQIVTSPTTARAIFTPPSTDQSVTVTDPSSGLTAPIWCSGLVPIGGGTGYTPGAFSPQAVAMVNNTAGESFLEKLLKPNTPMRVEAYAELDLDTILGNVALNTGATLDPTVLPTEGLIWTLWRLVNGGWPSAIGPFDTPAFATLDEGLAAIYSRLDLSQVDGSFAVGSLARALAGFPGGTIQDVLTALEGVSAPDLSGVLAAIDAAKGDPLATIKAVLDALYILGGTTNGYTLSTVKTWVEAVRGSGLPTVKGVLDKLGGSSSSIEARIDALSDLIVTETTLQSIIDIATGVLAGRAGATLGGVLDAIDALPAPSSGGLAAPVWPGDGLATLGASHDLADGLIVDGPMHGLIVTIGGHPSGAGKYAFGSVDSWQHCGAVVFQDDAGHYERAESFGLPSQIITPRTMAKAASATVRLNGGWSGTIRGWTVTP